MITFIITFDEQVVQVSSGTNELSELVNSSETPQTNSRFRAHSLSKTWNSQVPAGTDRSLALHDVNKHVRPSRHYRQFTESLFYQFL